LAGFGYGAGALLDAAANVKEVDRIVVASGDFRANRTTDWAAYKHPVMLLHAPSAQCDTSPYFEAELLARKSQFALVQVGYNQTDPKLNCGRGSQHIFTALEAAFATTVAQWLGGAAAPATIGYPTPQVAWREQLLHYTAPAAFGSNRLEMTLLLPSGVGPQPVVVFSHGHIEQDTPWVRSAMRFVDLTLAREFLKLGWAVAFPTRQGVGLSEGSNRRRFSTSDGDPTYKARIESKDILPALDRLRSIPEIDGNRIIISGQSAGGYAAMHMAGLNLSGVIGVINFSGGRTDMTSAGGAGFINTMMVNGFAEFGKNTKLPMLWVFAENDSRYTANTIRASYKAFTDAGGKATLFLSPPIDIDGHFIHNKPDLWRQALRDYLSALPTEQTKP
jgi:dienelactone hydrolase